MQANKNTLINMEGFAKAVSNASRQIKPKNAATGNSKKERIL